MQALFEKIMDGGKINREEALSLYEADLENLCACADKLRKHFCGNHFDFCTITSGKSGKCSENCKFCAQSAYYDTKTETFPLRDADDLCKDAQYNADKGVMRFSVVTSGKRLAAQEIDTLCEAYKKITKETNIALCASHGLLAESDFAKLKASGVTRCHNNLETSRNFFPQVCTSHSYEEKIAAIKAAQKAGLSVCSGGIIGLGETLEDRVDLALELRTLGIQSVPVNFLNPIPGTPFAYLPKITPEDARRTVAIFRFILPGAAIRLAGGRGLFADKGESLFRSGANAAISGDMLTTAGVSIDTDFQMIRALGFHIGK